MIIHTILVFIFTCYLGEHIVGYIYILFPGTLYATLVMTEPDPTATIKHGSDSPLLSLLFFSYSARSKFGKK